MPLGLHNKLRVIVPGVIILLEGFLFLALFLRDVPTSAESWAFVTMEWNKATLFILVAFLLGGLYRFSGITHWVDDRTIGGMASIRKNIGDRLKRPFTDDPKLAERLSEIDWRVVRRVFFRFVDELPYLTTTRENAFYSGIGFYSFIDLAVISTGFLVLGIACCVVTSSVPAAFVLYLLALAFAVLFGIVGAKRAIVAHRQTSDIQLDTILADHIQELRARLISALDVP